MAVISTGFVSLKLSTCSSALYLTPNGLWLRGALHIGTRLRASPPRFRTSYFRNPICAEQTLDQTSKLTLHFAGLHMASKPVVLLPLRPEDYASAPAPSFSDWKDLWAAWDTISQQMVPREELLSKPIKLRNACIFYLGHIPTFLDIHLTRATNGRPTEPATYPQIFERGIDPDVDNPDHCHAHSEIPDEWPALDEILTFQKHVRDRVGGLYDAGIVSKDPKVAHAMWLAYEHEVMHIETFLYMLLQSDKTQPPAGTVIPDFEALALQDEKRALDNQWFTIPESDLTVGLDDPEDDLNSVRHFGWDNEKPARKTHVKSFSAKARPITNGEYIQYLEQTGKTNLPASWVEQPKPIANGTSSTNGYSNGENGSKSNILARTSVRTVYGHVPLKYALHWPVFASYDELTACAQWMGGHIPTADEVRSIYNYVEHLKGRDFGSALGKKTPAVNGFVTFSYP